MGRTLAVVGLLGIISAAAVWFMMGTTAGAIGRGELRAVVQGPASDETVLVTVDPGENAASIGRKLEDAGVIRDARLFQVVAGLMGAEDELAAGQYEFPKGIAAIQAVSKIRRGETATTTVTVPEGRRLEEVADIVAEAGLATRGDFIAAASRTDYGYEFLAAIPEGATLEGFLFPDTYTFPKGVTAQDVVDVMLRTFQDKALPEIQPGLEQSGLTLYEVVTLASVVEREAVVADERSVIASVFLNRLEIGMALGADPTVQYALTVVDPSSIQEYGYWKKDLTYQDLQTDSVYNTRLYAGLMPTPIASPGLGALMAVVQPAETNYLYFVCKGGGQHAFSETAADHQANVAQYGDDCGGES